MLRPIVFKKTFLLFILSILLLLPSMSQADCVILLHGLARSASSMNKLERHLEAEGYDVINVDYPSTKHPIEFLAETAIGSNLGQCSEGDEVNFVTHSLGGILVRQYLSENEIPKLGRVVMLGPPNKGSEVVDNLGNFPGFYFINGDAGMQLGTYESSVPNLLGRANFDLGVIAGTRSINLILSMMIPDTDDGKVSIERTKLEGMTDHIEFPVSHPFIMKDDNVIEQAIHFLEYGKFNHAQ
ncbi:MAG TPA: hypothetical protein VJ974_06775 [Geopsychrobacteraceae bacterium]|nr:hypothetical protein [Geopsychrobacteraceae bacterium]